MATKESVERLLERYPLPESRVKRIRAHMEEGNYESADMLLRSLVEGTIFVSYQQNRWPEEYPDLMERSERSWELKSDGSYKNEEGISEYKGMLYRKDDPKIFQSKEQIDLLWTMDSEAGGYLHSLEDEYMRNRWPDEYPDLQSRWNACGQYDWEEGEEQDQGFLKYRSIIYRKDDPNSFQSEEQIDRYYEMIKLAEEDCYGFEYVPGILED